MDANVGKLTPDRRPGALVMVLCSLLLMVPLTIGPMITDAQGIEIAPTPTPTPLPGIAGNSYQSRHGWSMEWNDMWTASLSFEQTNYEYLWRDDSLHLSHLNFPQLQVVVATEGSDRSVCYELTRNREAAVGTDGNPLAYEGDAGHSWIVTLTPDGIARYQECRKLNNGTDENPLATYVIFTATAPVETYMATAGEIEALTTNLQPSPDALPRPTPTPEPTPTREPVLPVLIEDGSYTDPVHGWALSWPEGDFVATVEEPEPGMGGILSLENQGRGISIHVTGINYARINTAQECVQGMFSPPNGFGFEEITDQVDPSRMPSVEGDVAWIAIAQRPSSGTAILFGVCVQLGSDPNYLRFSAQMPMRENADNHTFFEEMYGILTTLQLP